LQVDDATLAQTLLTRAQNGDDFAFLAEQNSLDRITAENGGDLGFFARGSLLVPEVEEAAFSLQPNELSDVIAVPNESGQMTYYLVQVIEREAQRPLSANMQYTVLQQLFADWLAQQWAGANIQRLVNTDA
jgi:parvulin-like peptidyl-prolyl isomerase